MFTIYACKYCNCKDAKQVKKQEHGGITVELAVHHRLIIIGVVSKLFSSDSQIIDFCNRGQPRALLGRQNCLTECPGWARGLQRQEIGSWGVPRRRSGWH
jgi:hypothetical protein